LSQRQVAVHCHDRRDDQADTTERSKPSDHDFPPDYLTSQTPR
jgi:hypothetical protein